MFNSPKTLVKKYIKISLDCLFHEIHLIRAMTLDLVALTECVAIMATVIVPLASITQKVKHYIITIFEIQVICGFKYIVCLKKGSETLEQLFV